MSYHDLVEDGDGVPAEVDSEGLGLRLPDEERPAETLQGLLVRRQGPRLEERLLVGGQQADHLLVLVHHHLGQGEGGEEMEVIKQTVLSQRGKCSRSREIIWRMCRGYETRRGSLVDNTAGPPFFVSTSVSNRLGAVL